MIKTYCINRKIKLVFGKSMEGGCWEDGIATYPVFQGSGGGEKLYKSRGAAGDRAAALSRQIQDLEAELGTTLFLRTPHKVSLTEEESFSCNMRIRSWIW